MTFGPDRRFALAACDATAPAQRFTLEPNGNLHRADDDRLLRVGPGRGGSCHRRVTWGLERGLVLRNASGGGAAGGTLCSPRGDRFPARCLARRHGPPPAPTPGPPTPAPTPAPGARRCGRCWPSRSPAARWRCCSSTCNMHSQLCRVHVGLAALGFEGASVHVHKRSRLGLVTLVVPRARAPDARRRPDRDA
jgi:hypothetical protein